MKGQGSFFHEMKIRIFFEKFVLSFLKMIYMNCLFIFQLLHTCTLAHFIMSNLNFTIDTNLSLSVNCRAKNLLKSWIGTIYRRKLNPKLFQ